MQLVMVMEDVYVKMVMQDRVAMYVHCLYKKWNGSQYISSNVNEVIRAVFFITFFLQKYFTCTKKPKMHISKQKKTSKGKSCLFAYLRFCAFCAFCLVASLCFLCFGLVASLYFLCFLCVCEIF